MSDGYALRGGFALGVVATASIWVAVSPSSSFVFSIIGWASCALLWLASILILISAGR